MKTQMIVDTEHVEFFQAIEQLLDYGEQKHKENSFQRLIQNPEFKRTERLEPTTLSAHSRVHWIDYLKGIPHDYFGNRLHQLAAVAVQPLMEWLIFSKECEREIKKSENFKYIIDLEINRNDAKPLTSAEQDSISYWSNFLEHALESLERERISKK